MPVRDLRGRRFGAALTVCCLALAGGGCRERTPYPVEAQGAELQAETLRRVGAPEAVPEGYIRYQGSLAAARSLVAQEDERWFFLRDYAEAQERFRAVLAEGTALAEAVATREKAKVDAVAARVVEARGELAVLREVTELMNEGRLGRRGLMKAEIALDDAERELARGDHVAAGKRVEAAEELGNAASKALGKVVCRYLDGGQLARWRQIAADAVAESKRTGGLVLLVLKLERKLILYRNGKTQKTYSVGLGMNGLSDKLFRGDKATPEGRYTVYRKVPNSQFHLALLLDYPNAEDRQRFARAKAKGLIPPGRGIGSLIAIHGGGKNSVTEGCVSLDNPAMEDLYAVADEGTPVYIAGALEVNRRLAAACPTKPR